MTNSANTDTTSVRCDMSDAPDTGSARLAEFGRLFAQALIARERTGDGIRFRLRAHPGVEQWVRDLAAREQTCCAFFDFRIVVTGDEVHWDTSVADDDVAHDILEELFALPETAVGGLDPLEQRYHRRGIHVTSNADGTVSDFHRTDG